MAYNQGELMETAEESVLLPWSAAQCRFTVAYLPRVLDDIRLAVMGAFFSLPRGGAEVGGILLGDFRDGQLRITGYAEIECEHKFGPSFTLSDRDQARLAAMLEETRRSSPNRLAAGWYHSHTRSEIHLSGADQEIHRRFFPEAWQTALVLRPHALQPTRAGFFFREEDGSIRGDASYREFALEPMRPRPAAAAEEPASPAPRRESVDRTTAAAAAASEKPPVPGETPPTGAPEPIVARGEAPRRRSNLWLVMAAGLAIGWIAFLTIQVVGLRRDLKTQTERAQKAEKALADARKATAKKSTPSGEAVE
jgi:proteasome lid subunit RPN8/RPN11